MRKLTEVKVKNFDETLGESLNKVKNACELYKDDKTAIDDPNSLDELYELVEDCDATIEDAEALQDDMNTWYDEHLINFRSMLGFSLQPLWGSVGLALSTLQMEESENGRAKN